MVVLLIPVLFEDDIEGAGTIPKWPKTAKTNCVKSGTGRRRGPAGKPYGGQKLDAVSAIRAAIRDLTNRPRNPAVRVFPVWRNRPCREGVLTGRLEFGTAVEPGVLSATGEVTGAYLAGNSALISTQPLCETLPAVAAPSELPSAGLRGRIDLPDGSANGFTTTNTSSASAAQLEELAYRYGRSYESYLVTEPDRECFWLPDRRGAVAFLRHGRYLHVGGGLLAAPGDWSLLLKSFVAWARSQRLRMLFYNIDPEQLPHFCAAGFQATKWGEEPILDLDDLTWKGSQYEWVRRQNNYALRHGLEFRECKPDLLSADEWDRVAAEVEAISLGTKAERPQAGDIGFLNGRFDAAHLGRRRLFLAHNTNRSRIEGFLLCNPCQGGTEWALELYRDHSDAVRGTIPFLMYQALRQFQQEGAKRAFPLPGGRLPLRSQAAGR